MIEERASSGRTLQPRMSAPLENMFLAPCLQRSKHGTKLHSFGGDHIFRSWRMIGIETPFDDAVVFKRLQTSRKRIGADSGHDFSEVLNLRGPSSTRSRRVRNVQR